MFSHTVTVRLADTDAAGVLYVASLVRLVHDAYEAFMEKVRWPLAGMLRDKRVVLPIIRAETDFVHPIRLGDRLRIHVEVASVKTSSYTIRYDVCRGRDLVAAARTVHVSVDPATGRKSPLPPALKKTLARHT